MKQFRRCAQCALILIVSLLFSLPSAMAQFGVRGAVAPGQPVQKQQVASLGPAGSALSQLVGLRPVLIVYWRPLDRVSENALSEAAATVASQGNAVSLLPVAALAAGQPPTQISARLNALGLSGHSSVQDRGQLARLLGISRTPSFALVDVTGTLRLVGGMNMSQQDARSGLSIRAAVLKAGTGQPVPNLGVLPAQPVHQMLGRKLPKMATKKMNTSNWADVSEFIEPGKKLLLFYWSPTCPHCKKALPELRAWYETTKPKDLVVVDVARADAPVLERKAPEIVADYPWTHLMDTTFAAGRALKIREFPTSVLISDSGEILSVQVGGDVDWKAWVGGS